jgi:hypothetical protein
MAISGLKVKDKRGGYKLSLETNDGTIVCTVSVDSIGQSADAMRQA